MTLPKLPRSFLPNGGSFVQHLWAVWPPDLSPFACLSTLCPSPRQLPQQGAYPDAHLAIRLRTFSPAPFHLQGFLLGVPLRPTNPKDLSRGHFAPHEPTLRTDSSKWQTFAQFPAFSVQVRASSNLLAWGPELGSLRQRDPIFGQMLVGQSLSNVQPPWLSVITLLSPSGSFWVQLQGASSDHFARAPWCEVFRQARRGARPNLSTHFATPTAVPKSSPVTGEWRALSRPTATAKVSPSHLLCASPLSPFRTCLTNCVANEPILPWLHSDLLSKY